MITAWILYALVVGTLLGGAALALEHGLRGHGLPSRWVWVGAILLSVAWPVGQWAWESRPVTESAPPAVTPLAAPAAEEAPATVPSFDPLTVEVPPGSVLRRLDGPILVAWALATSVLLLLLTSLLLRTRYLRRGWRKGVAGGETVLFSDAWGPAVVGLRRPQVVLPDWCRELDDWALRLILDHELEHVRAGDLRMLFLAGLLPILLPWHLPVWWQLARLRTAVEGDCDLRVLGRNPGRIRPYVDLLLQVGERSARGRPLAAMLSEPYQSLKRRIRIMTMPRPNRPLIRAGFLVGAGGALVALAGWMPAPADAQPSGVRFPEGAATSSPPQEVRASPGLFTPYTVFPDIRNRDAVIQALERGYPAELRAAGAGGTVEVMYRVDEQGRVDRVLVNRTSRQKALDDLALRIAEVIEFNPALNRDQRRAVWVTLPIVFVTGEAPEPEAAPAAEAGAAGDPVAAAGRNAPSLPGQAPPPTGEIAGTVVEAGSGQPIGLVQLYVPGTGRGTLSDPEGRFVIGHVPAGEREVVAELVGYGRVLQSVTVRPEASAEVAFTLRQTPIPLAPIVVRGRGPGPGA